MQGSGQRIKKKKVITGRWTVNSRRFRVNFSDIGEGEESVFGFPFSDFRIPTSALEILPSDFRRLDDSFKNTAGRCRKIDKV
jgi:hypothetical protein